MTTMGFVFLGGIVGIIITLTVLYFMKKYR